MSTPEQPRWAARDAAALGPSPYVAKQGTAGILDEMRSLARQLRDAADRLEWTLERLETQDDGRDPA